MPIRTRLKKKIKRIIGLKPAEKPAQQTAPPPEKPAQKPEPPPETKETVKKEAAKKAVEKKEAPETSSPKPAPTQNKVSEEKILRHLLRTKKGLLKFLQKEGGTADLAALHTHSETRFLIGHQKFSQLMESMVDDELVLYNWDSQEATLTKKGIDFIAD